MDYTGKKVIHESKYGKGVIVSQSESGIILVKFDNESELRKFSAPICFKQYLTLCDTEAAMFATSENRKLDRARKDREEKQTASRVPISGGVGKKKQSISSGSRGVRVFSSVDEFCSEQDLIIGSEMKYLRENGERRNKLREGRLVEAKGERYIYSFEAEAELNLPDNTQITLWPSDVTNGVQGVVVDCEDFTVIISTKQHIGVTIPVIEFSAETWVLLNYLRDRLQEIREKPSPIVRSLVCDGRRKIQSGRSIATGQDTACQMSLAQPITFIWGPPGTGKTETLARIALQHLERGERVLMLSYSNVSVDGAIMRVFSKDTNRKPGKLVRYGYPKDKELLGHEYLTTNNLVIQRHPGLLKKQKNLVEERRSLSRFSSKYVKIGEELKRVKKQIDGEEKECVEKAAFVATTVTKAVADAVVRDRPYDTVIFDEASMAYVPQIVFSASLAKKHFICMGDFAQLPPIVQSSSSNSLNSDIFSYCGIVEAVESGRGHEWLCMLDTQYRMHPNIADFSSQTMYHGLLKSGPDMREQRESIVNSTPFFGAALQLVDLSGMMSVCMKTADNSRINILSALISFKLAIDAAKDHEVGIITPYHAQSKLLHAMARDVEEALPERKKIVCATVHQFQGSERDVIIYDAVDCYLMTHPGMLLTSTANNYANRLYNVAVTRAKGKMISVVNVDFMKAKGLSKNLVFRKMIDNMERSNKVAKGNAVFSGAQSKVLSQYDYENAWKKFLDDLNKAKRDIYIDIPGGTSGAKVLYKKLSQALRSAKGRGLKISIRTDDKDAIPLEIRPLSIERSFLVNPIALIDRKVVWYGMPPSDASFHTEGRDIATRFKPVLRFEGKHFATSLFGILEMNKTIDAPSDRSIANHSGKYDTFAAYVAGEMTCDKCGSRMKLIKKGPRRFFIGCSNFPKCNNSKMVTSENVENYFYHSSKDGILCPRDNSSLQARVNRKGLYICCCNELDKHFYNLDEI